MVVLVLTIAACQGTPTLGPQACPLALLEGTLVVDAGDLLVDPSSGGPPMVVQWPDGVHVTQTDTGPVLVGFFGQTIARAGEFVSMGGGYSAGDAFFQACGEIRFVPIGS